MRAERVIKGPILSPAVVGLGLALLLLSLTRSPLPIHAGPTATITVTTTADELNSDGDCSLREAIQAANTDVAVDACAAGGANDAITFDAATDGTPIVLSGPAAENANGSGDLDILDGGDLTIQGNGVGSTIVDGGTIDRVFHICPGGGCGNDVTISGVTIQNGLVTLSGGGGIRNEGGTTTLDDSAVIANTAVNGGGIANFATLHIQNGSTIGELGAGNWAYLGSGGGIYNYAGTTTVRGSTVISNSAANNGGGIWNQATLQVQDGSTISSNAADGTDPGEGGGGIYNRAGTTTVDNSTIGSNTAENHGGGIAINVDSSDGVTMTLTTGTIISNTAGNDGGGLYVAAIDSGAARVTLDGFSVSGNVAEDGGGVFGTYDVTLDLTDSAVSGNQASYRGGGIATLYGGALSIANGVLSGNRAEDGGGIYSYDTLIVTNSTFFDNEVLDEGGGVYDEGTARIFNTAIYSNTARGGGGVANYGTVDLANVTISDNRAEYGGGILNTDWATLTNVTITGNGADSEDGTAGGGIYTVVGYVTMDDSTISANAAELGGGIYNYNCSLTVDDSTVSANTAERGGGIYNAQRGAATVTGSRILNNAATINGGGVYNIEDEDGATHVTGSCIVGNSDTSFFNDQPAQQIATSNWWGAATGPNTPGADTVGGIVDTGGFLTAPILGCTPDLQVTKANDTAGETIVGTPFHWTLTISNTGLTDAVFDTGQEILVDDLPAGPDYGTPAVADLIDVAGGANIDCGIAGNSLTCEAGGGGVIVGAGGSLAVTFSVTPGEGGALSNPTGICRVDPDGNVTESDENNNCPTDTVEVTTHSIYLPLVMRNASAS